MNRKIICIVIALMVLSISAIFVANPLTIPEAILGEFSSTLGPYLVKVTISGFDLPWFALEDDNPGLSLEALRASWRKYEGGIVTFTGRVADVDPPDQLVDEVDKLILTGYPFVEVYPLDAPNLPERYELGEEYSFVGFLMSYERHLPFEDRGARVLRVNAFKIRHPGETKSDSGESDLSPDEDANPKDGTD